MHFSASQSICLNFRWVNCFRVECPVWMLNNTFLQEHWWWLHTFCCIFKEFQNKSNRKLLHLLDHSIEIATLDSLVTNPPKIHFLHWFQNLYSLARVSWAGTKQSWAEVNWNKNLVFGPSLSGIHLSLVWCVPLEAKCTWLLGIWLREH